MINSQEEFKLAASTTLGGVTVTLIVQSARADLEKLVEAQGCVFSDDEVSGLAQATLPALLPALRQARDQWYQSLLAAWRDHMNMIM